MLLRNFINCISLTRHDSDNMVKNCAGSMQKLYMSATNYQLQSYNCNDYRESGSQYIYWNGIGLAFGFGTTEPTINDYKIETPITTLTAGGNSLVNGNSYETYSTVTFTQTVNNATADAITINEIGIYGGTAGISTLFSRDVISPVTIAPNESKTFVVTIDLTQMSTSASAS